MAYVSVEQGKEVKAGVGSGSREPRRMWIHPDNVGKTFEMLFLDGEMGRIWRWREHNIKLGGKWGNFYPCREGEEGGCPFCLYKAKNDKAAISAYDALGLSIINITGFEWKGKQITNSLELLVVKGDQIPKFIGWIEHRKGLRGCLYRVKRSSENKDNIGDDWQFDDCLSEEDLVKRFGEGQVDPIDYAEHSEIAMPSREDMIKALHRYNGETEIEKSTAAPKAQADAYDDIPF